MRPSAAVICCSGARVNFFSFSKLSLTQSWMSSFIGATPPPQKIDQEARHGAAAAWIDEKTTCVVQRVASAMWCSNSRRALIDEYNLALMDARGENRGFCCCVSCLFWSLFNDI